MRPIFAVCVDHVERALEEYVDELLRAPDVYLIDDPDAAAATGGREIPKTCRFCSEPAKYLII
ncbi:MAG: CxxH/CxxC protein [Chloroflexota bacterium]